MCIRWPKEVGHLLPGTHFKRSLRTTNREEVVEKLSLIQLEVQRQVRRQQPGRYHDCSKACMTAKPCSKTSPSFAIKGSRSRSRRRRHPYHALFTVLSLLGPPQPVAAQGPSTAQGPFPIAHLPPSTSCVGEVLPSSPLSALFQTASVRLPPAPR